MKLNRRTVLAGLATVAALWPWLTFARSRDPVAFRRLCPPVHFSCRPDHFLAYRRCVAVSDWHYQAIDPARRDWRGVLRHLPTGFTYYTLPDNRPDDPLLKLHMAYMLFAEGESISDRYAERLNIGRAAGWVASLAENCAEGPVYIPAQGMIFENDDEPDRPAPPFIVAEIDDGFLLHV
ncbi:hypothetical protein NLM31_36795 [Bradyrhizobium sp. CCGUVB4N]|uniref:hypothetical protein n=1 Tax=Bradyrhizobium sp. CCGUVB4N TaxID=2949631 RepID=UPI0020B1E241|nr:hypothetical protein [Bradyrhizobium sp. CCGUVB4N]MCP3385961.1 hypothetical protein [Bradyrhizobium sp. CCGUVB4N]